MWHTVLAAVLALCATLPAAAEPLRRVRVADAVLHDLVDSGRERSAGFRDLIDRLETGDWLVFVQPGRCVDRALVGCLLHLVGTFEGRSYLRLIVDAAGQHPDQVIATLAHELQHAWEVISHGGAADGPSLRVLVERISDSRFTTPRAVVFETRAARRIGDLVLRELVERRSARR